MSNVGGAGRPGGMSDFEYDHPEILDGDLPVSEGADTEAAAIASTSRAPKPNVTEYPFKDFSPQSIKHFRDGGTITTEGPLNRYAHATVRLDGAINSPTRGQLFTAVRERSSPPPAADRPMTKGEMQELKDCLEKFVKDRPDADPSYKMLLEGMKAALKASGAAPKKP
jgi:hypothetical protein